MAVMAARAGSDYKELQRRTEDRRASLMYAWQHGRLSDAAYTLGLRKLNHEHEVALRELDQRNMAKQRDELSYSMQAAIPAPSWASDTHPLHDAEVSDTTQGEMNMNILKTKVIGVKFLGGGNSDAPSYEKIYAYFTDDMSIVKDDYCIVIGASGAPCIVKVYDDAMISKAATKMIVCKIDLSAYNEKMKLIVARTAALKRLKEIDEEVSAQQKYAHLVKHSAEAAELLEVLGMMPSEHVIEGKADEQKTISADEMFAEKEEGNG